METEENQIKANTIEQIIKCEHDMVLAAPARYGKYYEVAYSGSMFMSNFVKSVNPNIFIFAAFMSQAKKHHLLALLSIVRLHSVQSLMNLRQVLEAGCGAAYAIANTEPADFVDIDEYGIMSVNQRLSVKRYQWLKKILSCRFGSCEKNKKPD